MEDWYGGLGSRISGFEIRSSTSRISMSIKMKDVDLKLGSKDWDIYTSINLFIIVLV